MNKTKSREIQNAAIVIALLMDKLELEELEVSDAELTNVGGGLIDHRCDKCSALKIWRTRPKEAQTAEPNTKKEPPFTNAT